MDELKKTILDYVIHEYVEDGEGDNITTSTQLISGGIVDSFSMVSLKRFLEKKYAISIPDREASPEAFDSVDSIARLVEKFRKTN